MKRIFRWSNESCKTVDFCCEDFAVWSVHGIFFNKIIKAFSFKFTDNVGKGVEIVLKYCPFCGKKIEIIQEIEE